MDLFLLCGIAVSLLGVIISLYFFQKKRNVEIKNLQNQQRGRNVPQRLQEGLPRRAQIMRNQRNRLRGSTAATTNSDTSVINENRYDNHDDDDNNDGSDDDNLHNDNRNNAFSTDEKIGTKKRAKLEAKAEKRALREAELQLREERKRKEAQLEEQRKIEEKKAEEEEKKREEAERLAKEEKERKEYEEYLKIKENFSIEEEGFEEDPNDDEKRNLLQEFIQYIKDNKVVILEDVASHFKMKTQQVIERITELCDDNKLTGVIDDRGKFIYISEDELKSVAKFIKQRGRVSITELAESSNNLINLNSISANA